MKRCLVVVAACVTQIVSPGTNAETWVLPPEASAEVGALVGVAQPLPGGRSVAAAITRDRVAVTVYAGEAPVMQLTLRHPSVAPPASETIGGVAVDPSPGPPDEALLAEVVARMRASGVEVRWIASSAGVRRDDAHAAPAARPAVPAAAPTPPSAIEPAPYDAATSVLVSPEDAHRGIPWPLLVGFAVLAVLAVWAIRRRIADRA